jgi:hypothetical protein
MQSTYTQYSNYIAFNIILLSMRMRPPLWSSGQSSWLQIQRSGFDSRLYQIFWEVVGLERGPLSLVSTIEELLKRKSSGSGLENREYGSRDPSRRPRGTLYPQKLAITSPRSGGRSVGIVRSRTQTMEFFFFFPVQILPSCHVPCSLGSESDGLCRWCVTLRATALLGFAHSPEF